LFRRQGGNVDRLFSDLDVHGIGHRVGQKLADHL
jgi:hypothetical protein